MMLGPLKPTIEVISQTIGMIGIILILVGSLKALWAYLRTNGHERYSQARSILGYHLILGLDFLVGKDIIDTFLLHSEKVEYIHLLTLITVVGIRVVLTHFLEKEIDKVESREFNKEAKKEAF